MSKKQITELESADSLDEGDLILVRKTGSGVDRKLTKDKLVESLGSSAVSGYQATSTVENQIDLNAANKSALKAYVNGMRVCFISPITSTGIVKVKIDTLPLVELEQYSVAETAELVANEYVEAVYTDEKFKQTNKLNTNLVWSNEYNATGHTEGELPGRITIYELTSAIGVNKTEYYKGMSLLFSVPIDSEGTIFVDIDGLGQIHLTDGDSDKLINELYKDDLVMAVYDGTQFVKYEFANIAKPVPEIVEDDITPPDIPDDIWSPTYSGDPNDPANADTPNSRDSHGKAFFAKTVRVGIGGEYQTLEKAFTSLLNEYGDTGAGRKIAILLMNNYIPEKQFIYLKGAHNRSDLRWISIFSEGSNYINFNKTMFYCTCEYTPIFNLKIQVERNDSFNYGFSWLFYLSHFATGTTITFGKNTDIIFNNTKKFANNPLISGYPNVCALYGLKINTTNNLVDQGGYYLNKCNFIYRPLAESKKIFLPFTEGKSSEIYNTNFYCASTINGLSIINIRDSARVYLQNVESSDRINQTKGLLVSSKAEAILKNCRFASNTSGSSDNGYDIVIAGNEDTRIYLENTTGNTNQAIGEQTNKGKIIQTT